MWYLRKYYAGGKGVLPPTDPRILAMTPEQVDLEFEFIRYEQQLAKKEGSSEVFEDEEFDKYDEESDNYDRNISDTPASELPKLDESYNPDDWEDVEIDDFEAEEE